MQTVIPRQPLPEAEVIPAVLIMVKERGAAVRAGSVYHVVGVRH